MRVKITPWLSKIYFSVLEKSSGISAGDVWTHLGWLTLNLEHTYMVLRAKP